MKRCDLNIGVVVIGMILVTISISAYYILNSFIKNYYKTTKGYLTILTNPSNTEIRIQYVNFPQIILWTDGIIDTNKILITLNNRVLNCIYTNKSNIVYEEYGKIYNISLAKGSFSCFVQDCIPPGKYKITIYYFGYIKDYDEVTIRRYVCLNAKIDYIRRKIVGFARWNDGAIYNGTLYYYIDNGMAGEGFINVVNGYFEANISQLNFTYLLPKEYWIISWEDEKPLGIIDDYPPEVCYDKGCLNSEKFAGDYSPRKYGICWINRIPCYVHYSSPKYIIENWKITPIKITKYYIKVNYTLEIIPKQPITFDPNTEEMWTLIQLTNRYGTIEKCGGDNVTCYIGHPKITLIENSSGKIYHVGTSNSILFNFTLVNQGNGYIVAGCGWWGGPLNHLRFCPSGSSTSCINVWNIGSECPSYINLYPIPRTMTGNGSCTVFMKPKSSLKTSYSINIKNIKNYLKSIYGITDYNGTYAAHFGRVYYGGNILDFFFRFAINKPTIYYKCTRLGIHINDDTTAAFKFNKNITKKVKIWVIINFTRTRSSYYIIKLIPYPVMIINKSTSRIKREYGYLPHITSYINSFLGGSNTIRIPGYTKDLWIWLNPEIEEIDLVNNKMKIKYNLIIMNVGGVPIGNVTVYKRMTKLQFNNHNAIPGSYTFNYSIPPGWNLEYLFISAGFGWLNKKPSLIKFSISGYHSEIINCSLDPNPTTCSINTCLTGNCWLKCGSYANAGDSWYCSLNGRWRSWNNLLDYYTATKSTTITISMYIKDIKRRYWDSWINFKAVYISPESLWTNHMKHVLVLQAENTIYKYEFLS